MLRAVNMGAEGAAFRREFAYGTEGKDLNPAAVSKYRPVPAFEFVQPSGGLEGVKPGPEVEVIGVAQNYLSLDVILEVMVIDSLDGSDGPDRHKYGSVNLSVVSCEGTRSRCRVRVFAEKLKFHSPKIGKIPMKIPFFAV